MGAPILLQTSSEVSGAGSATVSLTGVAAKSTLVLLAWQESTGARTYSATSFLVGAQSSATGRQVAILYRTNVSAGSHSITVNANTGTLVVKVLALEFSECAFVSGDAVLESTNNTSHDCANAGNLDVPLNGVIVSGGVLNASGTVLTTASGATRLNGAANLQALWQYRRSDAGFVDERSTWLSSTARTGVQVSIGLQAPSGGFRPYWARQFSSLGMGV